MNKFILVVILLSTLVLGQVQISSNQPAVLAQAPTKKSAGSRDFMKWFDNLNEDAWGVGGFLRIMNKINSNILDNFVFDWLQDIQNVSDKYFPEFCNSGNNSIDQAEFAAFLTTIAVKTGFDVDKGFPCFKESGCPNCSNCSYNSKGMQCISQKDKQYYGRGPLLMQWDSSYKNFSNFYDNNSKERFLKNPNGVMESSETCWATAIWQWMTPQTYGGWCISTTNTRDQQLCNKQCPQGPDNKAKGITCKQSICVKEKWIEKNTQSGHNAIISGGGIGQVINIFTGIKNCCPSAKPSNKYGDSVNMVEIYTGILTVWMGETFDSKIDSFSVNSCPAIENKKLNCTQLQSNECASKCCSIISISQ